MTAVTAAPAPVPVPPGAGVRAHRLGDAFADAVTVTWRNVIGLIRVPDSLFFAMVQPVMFVLLFRYAFGGAVRTPPGFDYVDYLMPGIFVQTAVFGVIGTAIGLADDLQKGLIERFRSLPMAQSAVLAGRTTADFIRNVFVVILLTVVGFAVGFRPHTNAVAYVLGCVLLLFFAYALTWGSAVVGLTASNSETAQLKMFPILMPLTFASSAFVPVSTMPGWLQVFSRNQPVTQVVDATRALMVGGPAAHAVMMSIAWIVGLVVVLAPIAVHRFRRTS